MKSAARQRLARRALLALAAACAAFIVGATVINGLTPGQGGPTSSSYASAPDGIGAYAELLARSGHPVTRLRTALADAQLDPGRTLVLLDPDVLAQRDVTAVRAFVSAGGRLVAGGQAPGAWLAGLLADPPSWSPDSSTVASPLVPVPELAGVTLVRSAGHGAWREAHATLPVLADATRATRATGATGATGATRGLLTVAGLGRGRVALLADSSPLQNQYLASADNAALALALAGPPGRPVAFSESVHGYGTRRGLAALPTRWKWALAGLLLAAVALIAARIRRLGPPEPPARAELPPRRAHVEALALALGRTRVPVAAAGPVHERARALLWRRARLAADAGPAEVHAAGQRLGLDPAEARAVAAPELSDENLLAAGRALAKLSGPAPLSGTAT
jgi:hypothetical protein